MVGRCFLRSAVSWCEQGYGVEQHWTCPGFGFACLMLSVLCEPVVISNTSVLGSALNSGLCWLSSRLRAKWKEGGQWLGLLGVVPVRLWVTQAPRSNPNKRSYLTKVPFLFRVNRHPLCPSHLSTGLPCKKRYRLPTQNQMWVSLLQPSPLERINCAKPISTLSTSSD